MHLHVKPPHPNPAPPEAALCVSQKSDLRSCGARGSENSLAPAAAGGSLRHALSDLRPRGKGRGPRSGRVRGLFLALAASLLLFLPTILHAEDLVVPALTGRVVDDANVLSPAARQRLDAELAAHEEKTGQQIVVATLRSLQGRTIEDYGVQLGRQWRIGKKGQNNGIVLLVAPNEHKVRIEIGFGLEGDLTDADSRTIIERFILPRFKRGDIEGGVVIGAESILRALGEEPAGAAPRGEAQPAEDGSGAGSLIFTILVFVFFIWAMRRRRGGAGSFIVPYLIASSLGGRRSGGFGGFSGGSSGGGFSGGGGSFGGGGASGSW